MNKAQPLPRESSSLMGRKASKQTPLHYRYHVRANADRALRRCSGSWRTRGRQVREADGLSREKGSRGQRQRVEAEYDTDKRSVLFKQWDRTESKHGVEHSVDFGLQNETPRGPALALLCSLLPETLYEFLISLSLSVLVCTMGIVLVSISHKWCED